VFPLFEGVSEAELLRVARANAKIQPHVLGFIEVSYSV